MTGYLTDLARTFRSINSTAAGTTAVTGASYDLTTGPAFDAVRAVALVGALTATQQTALKLQESPDTVTWTDVPGSTTAFMADGDSNKLLITEVLRPSQRYVRPVLLRGTANAAVDGVVLELFRARSLPVAADGTVSQQVKAAPQV